MGRDTEGGKNSAPPKTKSITGRLTRGFFFRQLEQYLCMDFLLALLMCAGLFLWAEDRCAQAVRLVESEGLPSAQAAAWLEVGGYRVTPLDRPPEGEPFAFSGRRWGLHGETARGLRSTDGLNYYRMEMPGEPPYAITVDWSGMTRALCRGWMILLAAQFLSLLIGLLDSGRTVKRTLRPIQELATTAAKLTSVSHLSRRELEALAGELDKISGQDPDSRVDLPTTQKELRSLAQSINSMLERVNGVYRAQMRFVSDASHELRTPIAVIQGYAALLDRWGKGDPATRQEAIDAIRSEAGAMERLVEQLLFLARGDNNSQPVRKELFDLTELAAEVLRDETLIHQERTILPSWEGPLPVAGDPALLKQLMRILVDNSVKYSGADTRIWLRLSQREGLARVTVQDEGMGIAPEALSHIFDRFYRADASRARQTGGTGLGLSIAQWIVERHGGWFEVVSREGLGTRFSVLLPMKTPGLVENN